MSRATWFMSVLALAVSAAPGARVAYAQTGAFVMTLGTDTVQVEQFTRSGNIVTGVLAVRAPSARVISYTITLGERDRWESYAQETVALDGSALNPDPGKVMMRYTADSVIRDAVLRGAPVTHRMASAEPAYPLSTIPIGSSFLVFEFALREARATPAPPEPALIRLFPGPVQTQPFRTRVLYASPESVTVDYFGQGSSGFRFDADGRLLRSDWRRTTYKVLVVRVPRIDVAAVARGWQAQESGAGRFGALSPRDSTRGTLGAAAVSIEYSRPSRRGRVIWGDVVPWDKVWRLGADFATQIRTSADLTIGGAPVPAGTYTLWMVPRPDGSQLVINKQVGIFGTQYNPANDLVRVPLERTSAGGSVERLTLSVRDGRLWIEWGDAAYSVVAR